MWPPAPGSQHWQQRYGDALVCVRHREDPAGLRRLVTVELVVADVATRPRQRRLQDQAWYPLAVAASEKALRRQLRLEGGRWDAAEGYWYAQGNIIRKMGLHDRIAMTKKKRQKSPTHT